MTTTVKNKPQQINKPLTKKGTPTTSRKAYIEVMRIIAAFLVIVNHTNSDIFLKYSKPETLTWYLSISYFFLSKIAVPVFLMIMGGLLLEKTDSPKKSFQRAFRIFVILIVFSAIYYVYFHRNALNTMSFSDFFKVIFARRVTNAFWYLYTYLGIMIILPLLQCMAQAFSKKLMRYFLIISIGVMGFVPLFNTFFDIVPNPYFTKTFFVPLIGMVFAGFYIEHHMKITKTVFCYACLFFVSSLTFEVLYTHKLWQENPNRYLLLDNRESIFITICAASFYIIFKYLSTKIEIDNTPSKVICYFGSLTFGIYLFSDLILDITKPYYTEFITSNNKLFLSTILWQIIIFISSAVITAIIKLIPGIKKYI